MTLKQTLAAIANVLADEAEKNPEFRKRLMLALGQSFWTATDRRRRRTGRRAAAVLDPIELAKRGEAELRCKLADLHLDQLLDIVAQFGMDPGKLVMKWKDRVRIVDRIVEIALIRATKGDAFRGD